MPKSHSKQSNKLKGLKQVEKAVKKAAVKRTEKKVLRAVLPKFSGAAGSGNYRPTSLNRGNVRGSGDYFSDFLGGVGKGAAIGLSSLLGGGDYRTEGPKSNSLMHILSNAAAAGGTKGEAPSVAPFNMGALSVQFAGQAPRMAHREFIGPVLAPANPAHFNTTVYRIQPGLSGANVLFPWGSSVAKCFQQYVMHGMILEFVSTSSNFATNSALGTVMMSTLYDASKDPLATELAVNNNEHTTLDEPCNSFYHPIECASGESPTTVKYVRTSNAPTSSSDDRLDDIGIFQLSTEGLTAVEGTQIGELWCTYDIEFLKAELPDLHEGVSAVVTSDIEPGAHNITQPYADATFNPANSLPVTVIGTDILGLPEKYNGDFLLVQLGVATLGGVITSWTASPVVTGSDITPLLLFPDRTQNYGSASISASNGVSIIQLYAFTTIAEDAANNHIWTAYTGTNSANLDVSWTTFILPLDNDVQPPAAETSLIRLLGSKGKALAQLLALYKKPPRLAVSDDDHSIGEVVPYSTSAPAASTRSIPASSLSDSVVLAAFRSVTGSGLARS
jgi:hypothetical protein